MDELTYRYFSTGFGIRNWYRNYVILSILSENNDLSRFAQSDLTTGNAYRELAIVSLSDNSDYTNLLKFQLR
jgi:hypothetical protein